MCTVVFNIPKFAVFPGASGNACHALRRFLDRIRNAVDVVRIFECSNFDCMVCTQLK